MISRLVSMTAAVKPKIARRPAKRVPNQTPWPSLSRSQ